MYSIYGHQTKCAWSGANHFALEKHQMRLGMGWIGRTSKCMYLVINLPCWMQLLKHLRPSPVVDMHYLRAMQASGRLRPDADRHADRHDWWDFQKIYNDQCMHLLASANITFSVLTLVWCHSLKTNATLNCLPKIKSKSQKFMTARPHLCQQGLVSLYGTYSVYCSCISCMSRINRLQAQGLRMFPSGCFLKP